MCNFKSSNLSKIHGDEVGDSEAKMHESLVFLIKMTSKSHDLLGADLFLVLLIQEYECSG